MKDEEASVWIDKIAAASKVKKEWSDKFKTDGLERYYEGFQYADGEEGYVLNMFYSTIEVKMPSLLFDEPNFKISPKPKDIATDPEQAFLIATNLEDTLNELIRERGTDFSEEVESAILDAWFRFGVVEVGYSADWIDNPNLVKPVIASDYRNDAPITRPKRRGPAKLPVNETVYFKYVPASNFIVSTIDSRYLHRCNWCGYFEFLRLEDLLATSGIKGLDRLSYAGYRSREFPEISEEYSKLIQSGDYVKVWKIWDIRSKTKYLISETHSKILKENPYDIFPLCDLRFKRRLRSFYPIPPSFNWISPQNELNDAREANRLHRRRFKRCYTLLTGSMERDEAEKVINGPDGTIAETNKPSPLEPVPNADLGAAAATSMVVPKDDFNIVAGTTSEQRGEADRTTATQASIANNRAGIRENRERVQVAKFLIKLAKLSLEIIRKKFVNPIQVRSFDMNEVTQMENESIREINPMTDLGESEFDYNVIIDIESLSPIANDAEKQKFIEFITVLAQYPQFSLSPIIVRELAFRIGYKNERVIKEFQRMAQLAMLGQVEQGMSNLQGQQQTAVQNREAQMQPPTLEQVGNQLSSQTAGL